MFSPTFDNSRPDGFAVLEVTSGVHETGQQHEQIRLFVPLQRTELTGDIMGPLAAFRLSQTYSYSREQCDKTLEAVYRFPLPGDAAVTTVRVHFGEAEIRTELKPRQQAERSYDTARQEGKQAALLTRESPDVFTLQITGLQPDQPVTVETSYVQLARAEGTGWSLRTPLTTVPRYVRSDEINARHAQGQPLFLLRDPGHRFSMDVRLRGAATAHSPTHRLEVTAVAAHEHDYQSSHTRGEAGGGINDRDAIGSDAIGSDAISSDQTTVQHLRVRLRDGEVIPDRDCVLVWQLPQRAQHPTLQVLLHDAAPSPDVYFLALLSPPATHEPGRGVSREITLLVDHSGSMEGPKWQAADWTVSRFLSDLSERDAFALGLFHNTTRWFDERPVAANARSVEAAIAFLEKHRDSGGTELGVALEQALHLPRAEGERARHILIVTDAQVTDEGRILRLVSEEAEHNRAEPTNRRRVSVVCIDAAPNSFLAAELAQRGGGVARFLTSDPDQEDITTALDEVLKDWAEPVATGSRLEVNRSHIEAAGCEVLPAGNAVDIGDLPMGRTVWIVGRVPRGELSDVTFRAITARGREVATFRLPLRTGATDPSSSLLGSTSSSINVLSETAGDNWCPALKSLFGARRILGLEFLIHAGYGKNELSERLARLGYNADEVLRERAETTPQKVYAENVRIDASEALRALLVREALDYGLASSETAFVAVRTEAGQVVEETVAVGNALPSGWSGDFSLFRSGGLSAFAGGTSGYILAAMMPVSAAPPPSSPSTGSAGYEDVRFSRLPAPKRRGPTLLGQSPRKHSEENAHAHSIVLFSGIPVFVNGEAVLFDSSRAEDGGKLPDRTHISGVVVRFPSGGPQPDELSAGLTLLIFIDDLSLPRARMQLVDVLRRGGKRPLNLLKAPGQIMRVVLLDLAGAWTQSAPPLEVSM